MTKVIQVQRVTLCLGQFLNLRISEVDVGATKSFMHSHVICEYLKTINKSIVIN